METQQDDIGQGDGSVNLGDRTTAYCRLESPSPKVFRWSVFFSLFGFEYLGSLSVTYAHWGQEQRRWSRTRIRCYVTDATLQPIVIIYRLPAISRFVNGSGKRDFLAYFLVTKWDAWRPLAHGVHETTLHSNKYSLGILCGTRWSLGKLPSHMRKTNFSFPVWVELGAGHFQCPTANQGRIVRFMRSDSGVVSRYIN